MVILLLYIFLTLGTIHFYLKKQYKRFLILLSIIIYKGLGFIPSLIPESYGINTYNFVLIVIISIICLSKKQLLSYRGDKIAKIIYLILTYQLIATIVSGIIGIDSWINVFGQYRFCLVLLLYFILRPISPSTYKSLLSLLIIILTLDIILFIIYTIIKAPVNPFKNTVFVFAPVIFYYILFEKLPVKLRKFKNLILIILSIGIISLLARMLMLAIIGSLVIFLYKFYNIRKLIVPILLICVLTPIIMVVLETKKNQVHQSNDLSTELKIIEQTSDYSDYNSSSGALRYISIIERIEYMTDHPSNLIFGVGSMKEITAQDKLSFVSGTHGHLEGNNKVVVLQLDTDDIGLLSSFMRYGLVYVILFIWLCREAFKRFTVQIGHKYIRTAYLTLLMMLLAIPGASLFFADWTLFPYLSLLSISGHYALKRI